MHGQTIDTAATRLGGRSAIAGAVGGLGLVLGGCFSLTQGSLADASTLFSQRFQCPIERVAAGIEPVSVKPPPPDVAADPARLAMYNQQVAEELGTSTVIDASGCGQSAMYRCVGYDTRHHGEQIGCVMIERGKLGLSIVATTRTIDRVEPGGLGERIGFRVGDALVALDHQPVTEMADYLQQVNDPRSPGHVITVLRAGARVDVSVPRLGD